MTLSTTTTPHFLAHLPPYVRSALLDVVHPPLRYSAGAKKNTNTSVTPADTIKHLLKISHPSLDFRHNPNLGSDLCPVWESLRSISQKRLDHFETTCDDAITASKATLSIEEQMTGFTMTYILSPISAMLADPTTILRAERIRRRIYQETGTRSGGGGNADAALMEPKDLDAEDPARDGEWGDDGEEYQDFITIVLVENKKAHVLGQPGMQEIVDAAARGELVLLKDPAKGLSVKGSVLSRNAASVLVQVWTEHAKAGVAYGVLFAYDSWIVFHDAGSYIEVSNVYTRRDESLAPKLANEIVVSSTSTAPVSQAPTTETSVSTPEGSGVADIGRGPGSAGPSNPKAQTAHADLGDIDPLSTPVLLFITMSLLPPELFLPVEDKRPRKPSGPLNRQSKRLRRDEPGQVAENEQDAEGGGGGEGEEEKRAGREPDSPRRRGVPDPNDDRLPPDITGPRTRSVVSKRKGNPSAGGSRQRRAKLGIDIIVAQASLDSTAVAEWSLVDEHDEEVVPYVHPMLRSVQRISPDEEDGPRPRCFPISLGDDRLVITISDNADLSEAWHTYYHLWSTGNPFFGPYSLNRYPTLPTLLPGSISLSPPDLSLQIVSFISRGAIWDCFALSNPGQVVKMTCPGMFDRIKQDADERYTEIVARRSVVTEMEVFSVMKDLQGSVVPRLGGLWGSVQQGKETWCLVMEHGGQRLDSLDDKQWTIVEDHYRRIHERGVSHGDVDPRHWLWNKTEDGAWVLRIIDFERATVGDEVAIGEEEEYLAELRMTGRL